MLGKTRGRGGKGNSRTGEATGFKADMVTSVSRSQSAARPLPAACLHLRRALPDAEKRGLGAQTSEPRGAWDVGCGPRRPRRFRTEAPGWQVPRGRERPGLQPRLPGAWKLRGLE